MSVAVFEIPLQPTPQKINVLLGLVSYNLTVVWRDADQGGWFLDIADVSDNPILRGLPLITGADLLAQYKYLDFGGKLVVQSDSNPDNTPTFADLGSTSHLYWSPDP